ncbi:hypothetical protein [Actinomadura macra]|nr:hypothetical protein [Actinomadura macra]
MYAYLIRTLLPLLDGVWGSAAPTNARPLLRQGRAFASSPLMRRRA